MDVTRYLYVSRTFDGTFDADELIEKTVMEMFPGAERVGSGTGCGSRDMDFFVPERPSQEGLNSFLAKLSDEVQEVDVLYDEWKDEECVLELVAE